ncbi:TetR/AcrR family transcriptional regulator C-terminal domain-containing protein [Neotabrizicola shimadae]|uniref:TetR/AcrR family transcriptional regulator C-terminal domain-containing protein n=1 Tax=Neotabrizicola shimadae TaxID=2807096 RepID=A0A8G0ZTD8_9RHOB|nr:TetR/AcrR family transcriptional regulator C-terminal domain-containing protein [Neotabrizicola shimadae]QYZ68571.1 TetR/AcrR family transcriptional regulator C-terminal domain-containing protein [Neotabrizicola shimadae]
MKIDRTHAVKEALALLDEVGLDDLSTRKLAQRLGVQQPALYWHFRDKRALLDAMNAELMARSAHRRPPLPGESWEDFLRAHAIGFRACLLGVRDGARVHAGAHAQPVDLPIAEAQLAILTEAGFPPEDALGALVTLARYVVGFVLEEQAEAAHPPDLETIDAAQFPLLSQAAEAYRQTASDRMFHSGLEVFLTGLASLAVAKGGRQPTSGNS